MPPTDWGFLKFFCYSSPEELKNLQLQGRGVVYPEYREKFVIVRKRVKYQHNTLYISIETNR